MAADAFEARPLPPLSLPFWCARFLPRFGVAVVAAFSGAVVATGAPSEAAGVAPEVARVVVAAFPLLEESVTAPAILPDQTPTSNTAVWPGRIANSVMGSGGGGLVKEASPCAPCPDEKPRPVTSDKVFDDDDDEDATADASSPSVPSLAPAAAAFFAFLPFFFQLGEARNLSSSGPSALPLPLGTALTEAGCCGGGEAGPTVPGGTAPWLTMSS